MARVAPGVTCSDQDRKELQRLSNSRTGEARLVERANIVLACLAGRGIHLAPLAAESRNAERH